MRLFPLNLKRLAATVIRRQAKIIFGLKRTALHFKERYLSRSGSATSWQQGINLAAYIRAEMGLGQAARGMAAALETAQIPFNILNFEQ